MTEKRDYWDVPLTPQEMEELDVELMEQLNQLDEEFDEEPQEESALINNFITVVFIIAIAIFLFGSITRFENIRPVTFWQESIELAQDPFIKELQQSVVGIEVPGGRGTGFNIDPEGIIVTNAHVVKEHKWADVSFKPGELYRSTNFSSYPQVDLAILQIPGQDLPALKLSFDDQVQLEEEVVIIGNPLGFQKIAVQGQVVGTRRVAGWDDEVLVIRAPIHQGSSGSPVLNQAGEVVAIIFATMAGTGGAGEEDVLGLAVPVKQLLELLNQE